MKIIHLTTFYNGGAGNAAIQLHKALLEAGEDSSIIFVQSLSVNDHLPKSYSLNKQPFLLRIKNKWKKLIRPGRIKSEFNSIKHLINAEGISLPFSDYDALKHPVVKKADIIHLHWVTGMIDYAVFFKKCKKKIVWTLHDMNPMNGLFFYKEDEYANREKTEQLNEDILNIKLKAFNSINTRMQVTSPSAWLTGQAGKSLLLGKFECTAIPNIVDLQTFYPRCKKKCRDDLNIDHGSLVLLFTAMSLSNKRKGFDLLIDALKKIKGTKNLEIIAVGSVDHLEQTHLPIKFTGEIKDKTLLAEYYSAADVFILPSREDNLPNTMLEAFACGLPVIGFPVGGIKEYVINGNTGYLAEEVSSISLSEALEKFIRDPGIFSAQTIREFAEKKFSKEKIVGQFKKIYLELLKEN